MKFIHLADAHLDSPFLGLSFLPFEQFNIIKNSSNKSFQQAVEVAIKEKVDLFLIAGDTFDSITPSPRSQLFLLQQLNRLITNKIQVVMILGNHDYIAPRKMLLPKSPYFKLLGVNQEVETFKGATQSGFPYQVHGFSYQQNHIEKDMISEFPQRTQDSFNIGLMHAQEDMGADAKNVYAPFKAKELQELNYDYFALGHIHKRQKLSEKPLIAYSGNLQGRHINERGPKGVSLVNVNEQTKQIQVDFVETSKLQWQLLDVEITSPLEPRKLLELIENWINKKIASQTLVGIKLKGSQFLTKEQIELLQDVVTLKRISQTLNFNSALVKIYFQADETINLNSTDKVAFEKAKSEVFTKEKIMELATTLAAKGEWVDKMINKQEFISDVTELAQAKLSQKLRNNIDEADEN